MNTKKLKTKLNPTFLKSSLPWSTILDQEGLHWNIVSKNNLSDHVFLIITDHTIVSKNTLENFVRSGGLVLISTQKWINLYNSKYKNFCSKFLTSNPNSFFSSIDFVNINHSIKYPIDITINPIDSKLHIYEKVIGIGKIVLFPFDLNKIYLDYSTKRQQFYDHRHELPSEVVAKNTKSKVRQLLFLCIRYLYNFKNIPLIRSNYSPINYKSIFCFRIDTDFATKENAIKTNNLCEKYSIPATWFIETSNINMIKNVYKNFKTAEIAFHNDQHIIYNDYVSNKSNIKSGLNKLKSLNISNLSGFAAPFGEWNIYLNNVLNNTFSYSSEFGYDYDNLPSYPIIKDRFSNVMQIPIHPISIGRLNRSHYSSNEMIEYYSNVIENKLCNNEPIILYFHPNNKFFDVLENIFKKIKSRNIGFFTMKEYFDFWVNRIKNKPKYSILDDKIIINNFSKNLEVIYNNKSSLIKKNNFTLSDVFFRSIKKSDVPSDIKKINKKNWRNILYDFERYRTKRRM